MKKENALETCLACGKTLPYKSGKKYCSLECFRTLTPKMLEIQELFGKPIREVIVDTLNQNQNVTITAGLLGTQKERIYAWMDKLGIKKVLYWE